MTVGASGLAYGLQVHPLAAVLLFVGCTEHHGAFGDFERKHNAFYGLCFSP